VTPQTVEGFRGVLIDEGLSDWTVNKYLTVLHGIFVWAQRRYKLSGQERTVPMADEVAKALAKLNKRKNHTTDDDLVFCGVQGGHLAGHKLRDRYKAR
jgi:hypothetical protein